MNLANKITVFRMILVPVFIGCLLYWDRGRPELRAAAAGIFLFACITDALDGLLARRFGQKTPLGALIDPLADKALLVSAFFALTFLPRIPEEVRLPLWLTVLVISRDLLLTAGAFVIAAVKGSFTPRTNLLGKATTFGQMLLVLTVLWGLERLEAPLIAAAALLTLASGAAYLRTGAAILSHEARA